VPESGNFGLQPGDVVVAVDGRSVDSPSAFHRIIRSYQSAETFTLRVMRQKQSQVLTATMP
jgi:S1-C subfamily serine protease